MQNDSIKASLEADLDDYEHWIDMGWGVNKYEDDDITPIISMRDDLHVQFKSLNQDVPAKQLDRLRSLDRRWQDHILKNHDPNFRFNFSGPEKPKSQWWWWIDRLSELSEEEKTTI